MAPTPVTLLAAGSRGDVEPLAILAGALVARGRPAPDWPATVRQTGAILGPAPAGWVPPEPLRGFLDAGPRPFYVGLGSLNDSGGRRWRELTLRAARLSGRRIVTPVLPGEGPAVIDGIVCTVSALPHAALFPLMAGLVHHGGAGTTAVGLRSGVPSTAVPALFDQQYHARRLVRLGVGPRATPLRRLTDTRLAALLAALTAETHVAAAAAVGERVWGSDGLAATLAEVERLAAALEDEGGPVPD